MFSAIRIASLAALFVLPAAVWAGEVTGQYMEARTCQVYTGPCFANGEISLAGKEAIMAWSIREGAHAGVDLAGLNVVLVLRASDTLGFGGIGDAREIKSIVLVDDRATDEQREALVDFARRHSAQAGENVVRVDAAPIEMSLDTENLTGNLKAGDWVELVTRKARPGDCICSNESAYYPPLAELENFVPGVTITGEFHGRGLGTRWSIPGSRSAYLATFAY